MHSKTVHVVECDGFFEVRVGFGHLCSVPFKEDGQDARPTLRTRSRARKVADMIASQLAKAHENSPLHADQSEELRP
jgi:hypothetical protein